MSLFNRFRGEKKASSKPEERAPYTREELQQQALDFAKAHNAPQIPFPDTIPTHIKQMIARRMDADENFSNLVKTDPDQALVGLGLTDEQLSVVTNWFREQDEATKRWFEEEILKKPLKGN